MGGRGGWSGWVLLSGVWLVPSSSRGPCWPVQEGVRLPCLGHSQELGGEGWGLTEGRCGPGRAPVAAGSPAPTGTGPQRRAAGLRPVPPGRARARWAGRTRTAAAPCSHCPGGSGCGGRSRPCRGRAGLPGRPTGPQAAPVRRGAEVSPEQTEPQSHQETLGPAWTWGQRGRGGPPPGLPCCASPSGWLPLSEP